MKVRTIKPSEARILLVDEITRLTQKNGGIISALFLDKKTLIQLAEFRDELEARTK